LRRDTFGSTEWMAEFNLGLLGALAAGIAFWSIVLTAL
jgi:hypothetical protein